jgi:hypothetical protein
VQVELGQTFQSDPRVKLRVPLAGTSFYPFKLKERVLLMLSEPLAFIVPVGGVTVIVPVPTVTLVSYLHSPVASTPKYIILLLIVDARGAFTLPTVISHPPSGH